MSALTKSVGTCALFEGDAPRNDSAWFVSAHLNSPKFLHGNVDQPAFGQRIVVEAGVSFAMRLVGMTGLWANASSEGAGGSGGALVLLPGSSATVLRCVFSHNSASAGSGGAVFVVSGKLLVKESRFERNNAFASGGAIFAHGGAGLSVSISSSSFTANLARGEAYSPALGGAVSGALGVHANSSASGAGSSAAPLVALQHCNFSSNQAKGGAGVLLAAALALYGEGSRRWLAVGTNFESFASRGIVHTDGFGPPRPCSPARPPARPPGAALPARRLVQRRWPRGLSAPALSRALAVR